MGSTAYSETYTYNDSDGSLNTMTTGVGTTLTMGYDGLRRLTSVTGGPFNRSYAYRDISGTATTLQVSQLSYPNLGSGVSFGYTYDNLGNIATYTAPDGEVITYSYDNQGQLLKAVGDNTYTYSYDGAGNILTANGHTYTYGDANWKDLLTAFDGQSITYDSIGNPTSYYNGIRWNFTWANGRSLATATAGSNSLSFAYDAGGLRTSKTVNGVAYRYYYAGGQLMRMTWGSNTIDFFYDANGTPYAMKYNGTVYYYVTNLQGDVMRIVDASQNIVTSYDYDPYGKVISATGTLANINPLRYRGYVYDQETGFYYLNSRYYDPAVGRFINADNYPSTGQGLSGNNMFAYCGNNPVSREDDGGEFWNFVIGAAVGGLVGGVVSAVTSYAQTGEIDWGAVAINAAVGTAGGLIAASGLGTVCQAGLTAVISGGGNFAEQVYSKGIKNVNKADVICSTLIGGGTSLLGSAAGKLLGGKIEKAWSSLLNKGKDKLLSGMVRQTVGQSHSKLLRQGANFVAQGIKQINTYRGLSSSVGSLIGAVTSSAYNSFKFSILRW